MQNSAGWRRMLSNKFIINNSNRNNNNMIYLKKKKTENGCINYAQRPLRQ